MGLKGEKGETGVDGNRDFGLNSVGSGKEGYGGSCTLRKSRLRGRLDVFEGVLKSESTEVEVCS